MRNDQFQLTDRRRWNCLRDLLWGLILITGWTIPDVCIGLSTAGFKYFKLVQMPGVKDQELVFIRLDDEIYRFSALDYSDVRLFDAQKTEIPVVIQQEMESDGSGEGTEAVARVVEYPVRSFEIIPDTGRKRTEIEITAGREPLIGFAVQTETGEFRCALAVELERDGVWKPVAQSEMYREVQGDGVAESVSISFPETRGSRYRLVLTATGETLPDVTGVNGVGHSYRLVYLAHYGSSYQLFWGADGIESRPTGVDVLEQRLSGNPMVKRARIGRGFENPDRGKIEENQDDGWVNKQVIYILLIVGGILIIGSAMVKAIRKPGA
ncbi:hypothetical protein JXA80_11255 [bacterium]|nr:hypothetical protein [candidate division CSSED10-310 bacterium]